MSKRQVIQFIVTAIEPPNVKADLMRAEMEKALKAHFSTYEPGKHLGGIADVRVDEVSPLDEETNA